MTSPQRLGFKPNEEEGNLEREVVAGILPEK